MKKILFAAAIAGAMPKSAFAANSQAKVCAGPADPSAHNLAMRACETRKWPRVPTIAAPYSTRRPALRAASGHSPSARARRSTILS